MIPPPSSSPNSLVAAGQLPLWRPWMILLALWKPWRPPWYVYDMWRSKAVFHEGSWKYSSHSASSPKDIRIRTPSWKWNRPSSHCGFTTSWGHRLCSAHVRLCYDVECIWIHDLACRKSAGRQKRQSLTSSNGHWRVSGHPCHWWSRNRYPGMMETVLTVLPGANGRCLLYSLEYHVSRVFHGSQSLEPCGRQSWISGKRRRGS